MLELIEHAEPTDKTARDTDLAVLWKLLENHSRQATTLASRRGKFTDCVLALATATIALLKLGNTSVVWSMFLGGFLVLLGLLGALLTFEVSRECGEHIDCKAHYYSQIAERVPHLRISHNVSRVPSNWRWMSVHAAIAVFGVCALIFRP